MRYLVMEIHQGYCVVLDETGAFHRVANFGYEVGDSVENVIFMKEREAEPDEKRNRTGKRIRRITAAAAMVACMALVLTPIINVMQQEQASIHLSINPELTIEVNEDDEVTDMEAGNRDGQKLIDGCTYHDKHIDAVMDDLIGQAIEMGFLKEGEAIDLDIETDDGEWGRELGTELADQIEDDHDGRYTVTISVNGAEYISRHVIVYERETTTEPTESTGGGSYTPSGGSGGATYDRIYSDSGYGDSGYGGGAVSTQPATKAPAYSGGDSGYDSGDSGYGGNDSGYGDQDRDDD